jgi:flagellar biosynthesis protein FlhG
MDQAAVLRDIVQERQKRDGRSGFSRETSKTGDGYPGGIRVISVTSGKGGVGKTSTAANLALAFQQKRKRVLVLDADLGLANMDVMLGLNPRYTISNVLRGEKRIDEIMVTASGGFKILPAASGLQELTELDNSQRLFLLNELDTLQDRFDVLLIDTGAGISSNVMYFNFAAMDKVVIVTNEPTSLADAYALIKVLANQYSQKKFKILINSARSQAEADRIYRHLAIVVDKFLGSLSLDYIGWIPYDKHVPEAIRNQQTVLDRHPESPAGKSFVKVADRLIGLQERASFDGDVRFFWRKILDCG